MSNHIRANFNTDKITWAPFLGPVKCNEIIPFFELTAKEKPSYKSVYDCP